MQRVVTRRRLHAPTVESAASRCGRGKIRRIEKKKPAREKRAAKLFDRILRWRLLLLRDETRLIEMHSAIRAEVDLWPGAEAHRHRHGDRASEIRIALRTLRDALHRQDRSGEQQPPRSGNAKSGKPCGSCAASPPPSAMSSQPAAAIAKHQRTRFLMYSRIVTFMKRW